jgi:hypothetical protein
MLVVEQMLFNSYFRAMIWLIYMLGVRAMNEEKLKRRWLKEDELKIDSAISKLSLILRGGKFLWWLLEIGRSACSHTPITH